MATGIAACGTVDDRGEPSSGKDGMTTGGAGTGAAGVKAGTAWVGVGAGAEVVTAGPSYWTEAGVETGTVVVAGGVYEAEADGVYEAEAGVKSGTSLKLLKMLLRSERTRAALVPET